jgi:hypothetical protein
MNRVLSKPVCTLSTILLQDAPWACIAFLNPAWRFAGTMTQPRFTLIDLAKS